MLYMVGNVIVFIIVLSCFFFSSPPQILLFDFPTGSDTLIAGVVQETEASLDGSAPAVKYGGPPQIKQALRLGEYGRQGVMGILVLGYDGAVWG